MKKISIILALLLILPLTVAADTFASLWKKYDAAQQKDLPKTQIAVLRQIQEKALKTMDYGQLLKAELMEVSLRSAIAPDSLQVDVARLKQKEQQALETNAVLAAVYESALGKIYKENADLDEQAAASSGALGKTYCHGIQAAPDRWGRQPYLLQRSFACDRAGSRRFCSVTPLL